MSFFKFNPLIKSFSHTKLPVLLDDDLKIESEVYLLNRQIDQEERANKTKKENLKKEFAQYILRHEQTKAPNLFYSRKERKRLTDKIGCNSSINIIFPRDICIERNNSPKKIDTPSNIEEGNDTPQSKESNEYQHSINRLNELNKVLSNQRSDDLRFNELEYQSILAKETKKKTYDDYNKFLNGYVDNLINRNHNYLKKVLGFKESAHRKMPIAQERFNTIKNNIIPPSKERKYDLGQSCLKGNPIALKDDILNDKMIKNGWSIVNCNS